MIIQLLASLFRLCLPPDEGRQGRLKKQGKVRFALFSHLSFQLGLEFSPVKPEEVSEFAEAFFPFFPSSCVTFCFPLPSRFLEWDRCEMKAKTVPYLSTPSFLEDGRAPSRSLQIEWLKRLN